MEQAILLDFALGSNWPFRRGSAQALCRSTATSAARCGHLQVQLF